MYLRFIGASILMAVLYMVGQNYTSQSNIKLLLINTNNSDSSTIS